MASKSLHESTSATETSKDISDLDKNKLSNIHRPAKSHFIVRPGGPKHYADSDFVKPHESHANLNLSHAVLVDPADADQTNEASSLQDQTGSLSETVIHRPSGAALSTDGSSSDDEGSSSNTSSSKPTRDTNSMGSSNQEAGTGASAAPPSTNDDITGSISSTSLDSIHSDSAAAVSSSWSSITNIEETNSVEDNFEHPKTKSPGKKVAEDEAISTSPGRNLMSIFKAGLFAVRRNAVVEDEQKAITESLQDKLPEKGSSSSGDDIDQIIAKAHPSRAGNSAEEKSSGEETVKKDSSSEMQQSASGETMDEVKEATVIAFSRGNNDTNSSTNTQHQLEESFKSTGTAASEYETLDMEEEEGFVTANTLPNLTDHGLDASTEDTAKIDKYPTPKMQSGKGIVASNDRLQTQGKTQSDSSVEVIYNVKKNSSSLDGLAIAEERESRENTQLQQEIQVGSDKDAADKIASLQEELKKCKEELQRMKQQLDVQMMCEDYVRKEAEDEIQKYERKLSRLQDQINKPPKLINKHRKELRRIFQEIGSEGGPSKVWTTAEGLQQAIRYLYLKRKDLERLLHETEQHLQNTQSECSAWKRRAKEQEAAREQMMNDIDDQPTSTSRLLGKRSSSKSDTCLTYGAMDHTSTASKAIWGLQDTPRNVTNNELVEELKEQNFQLSQQLLDIQNLSQNWQRESNEAKSQTGVLKSKVDVLNSELIHERIHSQHLSTKLHNHNISAKSSRLRGLAEDLNDTAPPLEEAVRPNGTSVSHNHNISAKSSRLWGLTEDLNDTAPPLEEAVRPNGTSVSHNHNVSAKSSRLWGLAEDLNDTAPPLEEAVRPNGTSLSHNHNISAKSSRLWGLAEDLNDTAPPLEEAVRPNETSMCDIDGLEEWLGHLKAGQQHYHTELNRQRDEIKVLQDQVHHLAGPKDSKEREERYTENDIGLIGHKEPYWTLFGAKQVLQDQVHHIADQNKCEERRENCTEADVDVTREEGQVDSKQKIGPVTELKLWQELHQLRDVQLETLKDLEEKDNKRSDLQQRYSEILAEQLQQRAKLEMDMEDNKSEKQVMQERLEETQQLVKELHRKCLQLSQELEDAHTLMANQQETIQELKKQFADAATDKQEKYSSKDEETNRKEEELERRIDKIEIYARQMAESEKNLRHHLELYMEENRQMQKQFSTSASIDDKLLGLHKDLEEVSKAEQQFHNKYALQDKEIHHLHHHVSAIQTGMKQMVEDVVDNTLGDWQQDKTALQAQLVKILSALNDSELSRKATEDMNKTLQKNGSKMEENCKSLSKQLEQEWMGHQKTVDKLHHMQNMLSQQDQTKEQIHPEPHEDLVKWEHQLKEEAQRLSAQLHRIMGNHDQQVRSMKEANNRLMNNLKQNVPQQSYHDNVSSARARLQFLLSGTRPGSAAPRLHHTDAGNTAPMVHQPHRNTYTPAQGLQSAPDDLQTRSAAPLRRNHQRPTTAFTTYTESYHFPS